MRFPEFDGEWTSDIFINLVNKRNEKINPTKLNYKDDYKCIELDSLSQETGELLTTYSVEEQKSIKNLFYKNDILYSKLRPYLRKYYKTNFDGCCSSEIWVLNSNILNHDFLYQYIQTNKFNQIANISTGSKMPRADWSIISEIELFYPTNEEMNKIGHFFKLLDERIIAQSKIINKYKSLINQIYDCLLWNFKDTKKIKLSDILIEKNEKSKINDQYPFLSSTVKGLFLQSEYFDREIASSNNIGYKITNKRDIIISPQNLWMGNITYNDKYDNGLVSPSYKIYTINDKYNPTYISTLLKSYRALYMFKTVSEQGASIVRRNLNLDSFYEISFNIPSKKEQDKISKLINSFNIKISLEEKYLQDLQYQKKFLLDNMFI